MKATRTSQIVLVAVLLIGCTGSSSPSTSQTGVLIVATTTILGDIASAVASDDAVVEVLMPTGTDPHDFQPSSQQVASINDADLVIANGLGLEEGMIDVLEGAEADGINVLEIAPLVDPIPFAGTGPDEDQNDPHFWTDPLRVASAAAAIADALADVDPSIGWATRSSGYAAELQALDSEIEALFSAILESDRKLVTNHDALGYLADRYGFDVVGVVIPGGSTLAEPSSAELAALVEVMEEQGVHVIFAETIEPAVLAEAVAAEIGGDVEVIELYTDSLGPPGSNAETVIDMLRIDAERIAVALR